MNNNLNNIDMKFDPITGQPIQNITQQPINSTIQNTQPLVANQTTVNNNITEPQQINQQPQEQNMHLEQNQINQDNIIQNQMLNIPTVEQQHQDFINNIQFMNQEKKEEKKEGINLVFVIFLFIIILLSILFLFPILLKYS